MKVYQTSLNWVFSPKLLVNAVKVTTHLPWGPLKNHVDNRVWVGGLKFAIFVHVHYMKNVHEDRWVVKKEQNYVHMVCE